MNAKALVTAFFVLAGWVGVSFSAFSQQTPPQTPPPHGDIQTQPPAAGINKTPNPAVLKPKVNPDPGMTVATPNPSKFPMPVIPPPGTKGDNSQVVPK